jgi:hypothetical protein
MPTAEENSPPYTDADYYGQFMTALFGLIDDADLSGYDREATKLMRQARDRYWEEFKERHPDQWAAK